MTTQTLRKDDDGHAKHNKQTTTAERTAIRTAPELKDNDSRSAFIRHRAHHEIQTSTLSTLDISPAAKPEIKFLLLKQFSQRQKRKQGRQSEHALRGGCPRIFSKAMVSADKLQGPKAARTNHL